VQVAGGCLQAFACSVTTSGTKVLGTWVYMIMFGVLQIALAMVSAAAFECQLVPARNETVCKGTA
jgi:hypothetical protein